MCLSLVCSRAYRLLEPLFEEIVLGPDGQGVFCDEKHWSQLLDMVPDEDLRSQLHTRWSARTNVSSPRDKWLELADGVEKILTKGHANNKRGPNNDQRKRNLVELRTCLPEIVFAYLYPRLDANVSKQRNHLLKSPFAVHPKTGRVCVPVLAAAIEDFDPFAVPTLGQLQDELNQSSATDAASGAFVRAVGCAWLGREGERGTHACLCGAAVARDGEDVYETVRAAVRDGAAQAAGSCCKAQAAGRARVQRSVQRRLVACDASHSTCSRGGRERRTSRGSKRELSR